jgi:hypothetical protein
MIEMLSTRAPLAEETLKYSSRRSPAPAIAVSLASAFQVLGSPTEDGQTRARTVDPAT